MGKRVVSIIGSNPLTRDEGFRVRGADYWLFNEAPAGWAKSLPCSALFQMHEPMIWKSEINRNVERYNIWLTTSKRDYPVYMQEAYPEVPGAVKYPLREIKRELNWPTVPVSGSQTKPQYYVTNSVSYAIALAIHLGYEKIVISGVEMASETEYVQQRASVMLLIGIALGRGIEVVINTQTDLVTAPLYGYEGGFVVDRQLLESGVKRWAINLQEAEEKMRRSEVRLEGSIHKLMEVKNEEESIEATKEYLATIAHHTKVVLEYGGAVVGYSENARYLKVLDERIRAAGGDAALTVYENATIGSFYMDPPSEGEQVMKIRTIKKLLLSTPGNANPVTVNENEIIDVTEAMATHLIKTGFAVIAGAPVEKVTDQDPPVKFIDEMTRAELIEFAEENSVEIKKNWSKDKLVAALREGAKL